MAGSLLHVDAKCSVTHIIVCALSHLNILVIILNISVLVDLGSSEALGGNSKSALMIKVLGVQNYTFPPQRAANTPLAATQQPMN